MLVGTALGVTIGVTSEGEFGSTISGVSFGLTAGVGSTEGVTTVELSKVFVCSLTEKQQLY